MRTPLRLLAGILDFCIPPHCPLCGARLPLGGGRAVCDPCLAEVERLQPPWCPQCGRPFPSEAALSHSPGHLCADCRDFLPLFDRARALGPMRDELRELVHLLKFKGQTGLGKELGPFLGGIAREEMPDAVEERARVTHVPLHPLRWRERGYDQAQLLALAVAESLGLQHVEVLARRRDTPVQFRLPAARRRSNVRGAFAVVRPQAVEGKRLLLIDDVITTGSTVSACAEALKKAGAASVDVLAVCHTGAGFSYES